MAGDDGAPWDFDGAGGGEGWPELDGAGEDESAAGGDDESCDGGGAVEGGGLLLGGSEDGDGAVEELEDMTARQKGSNPGDAQSGVCLAGDQDRAACSQPHRHDLTGEGEEERCLTAAGACNTKSTAWWLRPSQPTAISSSAQPKRFHHQSPQGMSFHSSAAWDPLFLLRAEVRELVASPLRPILAGGWCLPHLNLREAAVCGMPPWTNRRPGIRLFVTCMIGAAMYHTLNMFQPHMHSILGRLSELLNSQILQQAHPFIRNHEAQG